MKAKINNIETLRNWYERYANDDKRFIDFGCLYIKRAGAQRFMPVNPYNFLTVRRADFLYNPKGLGAVVLAWYDGKDVAQSDIMTSLRAGMPSVSFRIEIMTFDMTQDKFINHYRLAEVEI